MMRRASLFVLRALLRLRARPFADEPGPALIVAPHPDDETLGCGGLIATRARFRVRTEIVFLTDGAASHPQHSELTPAALAARRREEAHAAATRLGLENSALTFLDLPDGRLSSLDAATRIAAVARLRKIFGALQPVAIFLPLREDGSAEHAAAFSLARAAVDAAPAAAWWGFPVWSAYSPRLLTRLVFRRSGAHRHRVGRNATISKLAAIAQYRSQIAPTAPWTQPVLPPAMVTALSPAEEFFFAIPR